MGLCPLNEVWTTGEAVDGVGGKEGVHGFVGAEAEWYFVSVFGVNTNRNMLCFEAFCG